MSKSGEISRSSSLPCSWARGPGHQLKAQLRRMERRGEISVYWQDADLDRRGTLLVPYVRLVTAARIRRRTIRRWAGAGTGALTALAGLCWLLWESRYVISFAALAALVIVAGLRFAPHLARGCSGLHCSSCKG